MRSVKISYVIGAIAVAVLFISTLQARWLNTTLDLQKQIFDMSVEQSLNTVAHWILVDAEFASLEISNNEREENNEKNELGEALITDGLQRQSRGVLMRMEALPMDSLLKLSLSENGIEADAVFGAFDRYGQPAYLDERSEPFRESLIEKGYGVGLGPLQFRIHFPHLRSHLLKSQIGAFILFGGQPVGIEVMPTTNHWKHHWKHLIRGCYGAELLRLKLLKEIEPSAIRFPELPRGRVDEVEDSLKSFIDSLRERVIPLLETVKINKQTKVGVHFSSLSTRQITTTTGGGGDIIFQDNNPIYLSLVV